MHILAAYTPIEINEDNNGCLALVTGKITPARTKHVAVRIGFIRDLIEAKVIRVVSCPTAEMVADPLTKPLGSVDFLRKTAYMMSTPRGGANAIDEDPPKIDDHSDGKTEPQGGTDCKQKAARTSALARERVLAESPDTSSRASGVDS